MVPTTLLFEDDAYRRNCEAGILAVIDGAVVLDATVFYPQGGGQPGDSGQLVRVDGPIVDVVDTRRGEQGSILHVCGADQAGILREGDRVEARIDWDRRYRHMRMHTCLHLLGSLLPYGVTGGNITAERSRLDFDMQEVPDREDLTQRLNGLIAADHAVDCVWITEAELDAQPELVRTLSVKPPRGAGRIRLLQIAGVDLQPCGGTHLRSTREIGRARVDKIDKKGRRNRRIYITLE